MANITDVTLESVTEWATITGWKILQIDTNLHGTTYRYLLPTGNMVEIAQSVKGGAIRVYPKTHA